MKCCGVQNYTDFLESAGNWEREYTIDTGDFTTYAPTYTYMYANSSDVIFSSFSDDGNDTIEAVVPISCCRVDRDETDFPGEMAFIDVDECLTTASERSTYTQASINFIQT